MALDKAYFDAIQFKVAKKKYYNAHKVDAVLEDIRRQAEELTAENARMREAISALAERRVELGDALLSAQGVYRGLIEEASAKAAQIVADAERRAAEIEAETRQQQDDAVRRVERCFAVMRRQHQEAIETLNKEWQDYLCGLYPEEAPTEAAEPADAPEEAPEEAPPDDLAEKVDAIARELFSLTEDSGESKDAEQGI